MPGSIQLSLLLASVLHSAARCNAWSGPAVRPVWNAHGVSALSVAVSRAHPPTRGAMIATKRGVVLALVELQVGVGAARSVWLATVATDWVVTVSGHACRIHLLFHVAVEV
eukprot:COSAG02_NODE_17175_length_1023_cov_1.291126_3_plen_111_part_00